MRRSGSLILVSSLGFLFLLVCLVMGFILFLFYYVLYLYLRSLLFSKERQKGSRSGEERGGKVIKRNRGRKNCIRVLP